MFSTLLPLCEENPLISGGSITKSQKCGALVFSLQLARTSYWTNSEIVGDLSCHVESLIATPLELIQHVLADNTDVQTFDCD